MTVVFNGTKYKTQKKLCLDRSVEHGLHNKRLAGLMVAQHYSIGLHPRLIFLGF